MVNLSQKKEELKISFKEFQKILLDHHIKSKDRYLKNFVGLFKKYDTDNNGIINEDEFVNILSSTNFYGEYLDEQTMRLLSVIDPNNNKQITFSECVSLFSQVFEILFSLIYSFLTFRNLLRMMKMEKLRYWIKYVWRIPMSKSKSKNRNRSKIMNKIF